MSNVEAVPAKAETQPEAEKYGPGAQSVHDIFELLAFYGLILAMSAAVAFTAVEFLSRMHVGLSVEAEVLTGLAVALGCAVAINWHFDSPIGKSRQRTLKRLAQTYAYPLTLLVGFYVGWQWRENNHPEPEREYAEQMAVRICAMKPDCLATAESAGGRDMKKYIKPSPMPYK